MRPKLQRYRKLFAEQLEQRHLLTTLPTGFEEELVANGLVVPTSMTFAPDGRIFVTEKGGDVRIIQNGTLLPDPLLSVPVVGYDEMGLESLALDPDFSTNGYLYVYYTHPGTPFPVNRLSRFEISAADSNIADPASETILLDGIVGGVPGYHNGGMLNFGPDGMLYVGVGDTVKTEMVQDMTVLQGKILRLNTAGYPNLIPTDNPFLDIPNARPEIWAVGFRNPFTGAFDPATGKLFVNDVGFTTWEEINNVTAGANYGWPIEEGNGTNPSYTNPVYPYLHDPILGGSITGGTFYSGSQFPGDYADDYFFSDYTLGFIRRFDTVTEQVTDFTLDPVTPVDLDMGPDGNLYWLSLATGSVLKVSYTTGNRAPIPQISADPTSGLAPLTVQLSAAGSDDPDGDPITYAWNFGDGTTSTEIEPQHTYATEGVYNVVLTVSDGQRNTSTQPLEIIVGDIAPHVTINSPQVNDFYRAGRKISFAGTAVNRLGNALPASAFEWSVAFHHRTHVHPFLPSIAGVKSGTFTIPFSGEPDPQQFYRVSLKVTNAQGIASSRFVDVHPLTTTLTLASNIPGLSVLLDNRPIATPYTFTTIERFRQPLEAPALQILNGQYYAYESWSHGADRAATLSMPLAEGLTFTANYRLLPNEALVETSPSVDWYVNELRTYNVTVTNLTNTTWLATGTNAVALFVQFGNETQRKFSLPANLAPNASVVIPVTLRAGLTVGNLEIQHSIRQGTKILRGFSTESASVSPLAAIYAVSPQVNWFRNQVKTYNITLKNTGITAWNATGADSVSLGVYFAGASDAVGDWPIEPARYALPRTVLPGETITLSIAVQAPNASGQYVLRHRLVKENVAWFLPMAKTNVTVTTTANLAAEYTVTPPLNWQSGEPQTYTITIKNIGTAAWLVGDTDRVNLGVYFGDASDAVGDWLIEPARYTLPHDVAPGATVTLQISVTAPALAGNYVLRHRMVKENVSWFTTMKRSNVNVANALPPLLPLLFVPQLKHESDNSESETMRAGSVSDEKNSNSGDDVFGSDYNFWD
jgi:glucose/arabinose dehydrogenase/PKD repeat protein